VNLQPKQDGIKEVDPGAGNNSDTGMPDEKRPGKLGPSRPADDDQL